jgi:hypothetical protein
VSQEHQQEREQALIFVYNADSGLFNGMADAAHKIFSPDTYSCNLCKVTYGWFTERGAWRDFIEQLDTPCRFLHRDEFRAAYPGLEIDLPVVLRATDGGAEPCIESAALNACDDIDALIELVRQRCAGN